MARASSVIPQIEIDSAAHLEKVKAATASLNPELERLLLKRVSTENGSDVAAFILAMRTEADISDNYRRNLVRTLAYLSEHLKQKTLSICKISYLSV